jgi:hypothetical protein
MCAFRDARLSRVIPCSSWTPALSCKAWGHQQSGCLTRELDPSPNPPCIFGYLPNCCETRDPFQLCWPPPRHTKTPDNSRNTSSQTLGLGTIYCRPLLLPDSSSLNINFEHCTNIHTPPSVLISFDLYSVVVGQGIVASPIPRPLAQPANDVWRRSTLITTSRVSDSPGLGSDCAIIPNGQFRHRSLDGSF